MDWTKVVTHPLGLAAFVLALVFGMVGVTLKDRQKPWFLPTAMLLASIALGVSLYMAYHQVVPEKKIASPSPSQTIPSKAVEDQPQSPPPTTVPLRQETHGSGSPALDNIQGDVTITINQSGDNQK